MKNVLCLLFIFHSSQISMHLLHCLWAEIVVFRILDCNGIFGYKYIQLLPKLSNVRDKTVTRYWNGWFFSAIFSFSLVFFSLFLFLFAYFGSGVNCLVQQFETVWTVLNKFPTEYVYLISQALIIIYRWFWIRVRHSGVREKKRKHFNRMKKRKNLSNYGLSLCIVSAMWLLFYDLACIDL